MTSPPQTAVIGRVVDHTGVGVPGAFVSMGLTSTKTDANGNFHVIRKRAGRARKIRAVKVGYLPGRYEPRPGEGWPDFVELTLPGKCKEITGTVVDAKGAPVAGALVWTADAEQFGLHGMVPVSFEYLAANATLPRGPRLPPTVVDDPTKGERRFGGTWHAKKPDASWHYVETDRNGQFVLGGLRLRSYRLRALHPETILLAETEALPAGARDAEIRMPEAASHPEIAGRVVLPDGSPAKSVGISVFRAVLETDVAVPGGRFAGRLIRHGARTRTDSEGRFRIADVPAQKVALSLYGDGIIPKIVPLGARDVTSLRVEVASRHHLEVRLDPPADRADSIRGLDGQGESIYFSTIRSGSQRQSPRAELRGGRSGVLVVPYGLKTVVFVREGKEIGRVPVQLRIGQKTVVRY